jgi:hypothetical protein
MYKKSSKKIYIILYQLIMMLLLWSFVDIIYSKFIYTDNLYGCFDRKKNFYDLKVNCIAKEKIVKTSPKYNVFTNEFGYRYSGIKKNETNKNVIAFMGDSFTYGVGLEYQQTFISKVEDHAKDYRVLNLAVPSYSPTTHLYQLEKLINKNIYPKKIILVIDLTDVSDEAGRWERKLNSIRPNLIGNNTEHKDNTKIKDSASIWKNFRKKNFKGTKQISTYINTQMRLIKIKFKKKITQNFTELGITRMGDFTYIDFKDLEQGNFWWKPYGVTGGLKKIESNIIKISNLGKKINADFYIVIYPWAVTLEFGQAIFNWESYGKNLCKISSCKKLINLFPDFNNYKNDNNNWSTDLFFLNDTHWNKKGNKIVAEKIISEIFN